MTCEEARLALGVYLLGALDPAERADVDSHLARCARCRADLADLAMLPSVLDSVSLDDIEAVATVPVAPEGLFDRVAARARAEAAVARVARRPRWHAIAAVAAAVVLVGGVSAAAVVLLRSSSPRNEVVSAGNGPVHMRVTLSAQTTGTALRVTVSGLPTDEHCRLLATADDGRTDLVGQWDATYAGEAQVTGSTAIAADHLAKLVLLGTDGAELVSVRV